MIEISGLIKTLYGGGHKVEILKSIDLTIPTGQFIAITGHSGSGKTTLLSLIAGLDAPTDGKINIDGQDITKLNEDELALLRGNRFGFIFQNFHLIPTLTALSHKRHPSNAHASFLIWHAFASYYDRCLLLARSAIVLTTS